ncbi:MAG: hypothetical protein JNL82_14015 [Myxococcales bacterium]|nr:hypothetical protein [Myxococcales bacterium]
MTAPEDNARTAAPAVPDAPRLDTTDLRALEQAPTALELRDDLHELVPALPATSFVAITRSLHAEGRLELVLPHATPEQLTALFDLDAWRRDRLDIDRARLWLQAVVDTYAAADKPRGALAELVTDMDPELWTAALLPGTSVFPLDPDDEEQRDEAARAVESLVTHETPDGFFLLAVPDTEVGHRVIHILDRVYADDLELARSLIHSLRGALPAMLEEDLLRWRSGRLADLGFVAWEEAMRLLRPLDVKSAREAAAPPPAAPPPAASGHSLVGLGLRAGLLRRALAALTPAQQGERAREFTLLVNELMAAQRFEPGDAKLQERAFHQAEATVGLGLELLATGVADPAEVDALLAGRIAAIGLRGVFRVGYGPLDKLRRAALALHKEGRVSVKTIGSLLDRPWGPALESLSRWYPELPLETTSNAVRPIAGLRDLARATELIAQAGALAALAFTGYAIDPAWVTRVDEPERLTLGDLVRTAIVHAHLPGSKGPLAPLTAGDLAWAADHLLRDGRLTPAISHDLRARCLAIGAPQQAEAFAPLLTRLEVELGAVERDDDGRVDLARVGSLLTVQRVGVWLKTGLTAQT